MAPALQARFKPLLEALGDDEASDSAFLHLGNGTKFQRQTVQELLQGAGRSDLETLSQALLERTSRAVEAIAKARDAAEEETLNEFPSQDTLPSSTLCTLAASPVLVRLLFQESKPSLPAALHATATLLHNECLLYLPESPSCQEATARLCLEWWQAGCKGADVLTPLTVPYFIVNALRQGSAASVKRCHAMRHALELFDWEDAESIGTLKRLLLQALFAPHFLRCSEGRRFLAHLFSLQPEFVPELLAIVKNQVPTGRASVLDAYGEILYRAISPAAGEKSAHREAMLSRCLQPLAEAALLASSPALAVNLCRVLRALHTKKHEAVIEKALLEAYEPVIWRRLVAPNPRVRINALNLLAEAFPLRDPAEPAAAADARLGDQFQRLKDALEDGVPAVRGAAARALSKILAAFWELVPPALTASLLARIAELALDSSSPESRCAAADALRALTDLPAAAPLLGRVLPRLKPQLFDASPKVRAAFLDLLRALPGDEMLAWHSVVSVRDLLGVLASDGPEITCRVQELLLPSFVPDVESAPALLAALLRAQPDAGAKLCGYLAGAAVNSQGQTERALPDGPAVAADAIASIVLELANHLVNVHCAEKEDEEEVNGGGDGSGEVSKPNNNNKKKQNKNAKKRSQPDDEIESPESWSAILGGVCALLGGLGASHAAGKLRGDDSLALALEMLYAPSQDDGEGSLAPNSNTRLLGWVQCLRSKCPASPENEARLLRSIAGLPEPEGLSSGPFVWEWMHEVLTSRPEASLVQVVADCCQEPDLPKLVDLCADKLCSLSETESSDCEKITIKTAIMCLDALLVSRRLNQEGWWSMLSQLDSRLTATAVGQLEDLLMPLRDDSELEEEEPENIVAAITLALRLNMHAMLSSRDQASTASFAPMLRLPLHQLAVFVGGGAPAVAANCCSAALALERDARACGLEGWPADTRVQLACALVAAAADAQKTNMGLETATDGGSLEQNQASSWACSAAGTLATLSSSTAITHNDTMRSQIVLTLRTLAELALQQPLTAGAAVAAFRAWSVDSTAVVQWLEPLLLALGQHPSNSNDDINLLLDQEGAAGLRALCLLCRRRPSELGLPGALRCISQDKPSTVQIRGIQRLALLMGTKNAPDFDGLRELNQVSQEDLNSQHMAVAAT